MRFRTLHKYILIFVIMILTSISFMGFAAVPANAMLVGTNGIQGAEIIDAPTNMTMAGATNRVIQAFNEAAGVILGHDLAVNGGIVAAGRLIDSHMIFLNTPDGVSASGGFTRLGLISFEFSRRILGVMSDSRGLLEAASSYLPGTMTAYLGASDTLYPTKWAYARGIERSDAYNFDGKTINLRMGVTNPGDWIRVVTVSPVPLPNSIWMLLLAMFGLGAVRFRQVQGFRAKA